MTDSVTVQVPLAPVPLLARAGIVAPVIVKLDAPGVAVSVPPTQVVEAVAGLAITSCRPAEPIGSGSVKLALVTGWAEMFVNTTVSCETVPSKAAAGEKLLLTVIVLATVVFTGPEPVALLTGPPPPVPVTPPAPI